MGAVVLDASPVIAVFDPNDPHHLATLDALRRYHAAGRTFTLPATALAEVLVGVARKSGATDARRAEVHRLFGAVRIVDDEVAVRAARLRARHRSLRLPDALVIATGLVDGADTILTADKRWAEVDERVEVLS